MENKLNVEFRNKLKLIYNEEELKIIENWFNVEKRKTTFRVNTLKTNNKEVELLLKEKWLEIEKIPFLENWYKLLNWIEKDLWKLDIYKKWWLYIQWISSQLPVLYLDLKDSDIVLDITAAPWSKTSQIWSKLNNTWEIIAIDNNQIRIDKLNYTLDKQWITNTERIKIDARNFNDEKYNEYFDNVLFDAPCSSEWRFNLNVEKSYMYWAQNLVKRNYKLQKSILINIIPMLKQWWTLVYSTCTMSPEENEAIVHFILSNFSDMKIVDINNKLEIEDSRPWITKFWDISYRNDVSKSLRILANEEMEWFFVVKFKKDIT